jgi:hypothetical protein
MYCYVFFYTQSIAEKTIGSNQETFRIPEDSGNDDHHLYEDTMFHRFKNVHFPMIKGLGHEIEFKYFDKNGKLWV